MRGMSAETFTHPKFRSFGCKDVIDGTMPGAETVSPAMRHEIRVVSSVLPFRVNRHVVTELIDWEAGPEDPLYRMVIPTRDALTEEQFRAVETALGDRAELREVVASVRAELNPHPSGQRMNIPENSGEAVPGLQHKYRETVLVFPKRGQTCHAYCSYCFRWAQFVRDEDLALPGTAPSPALEYIAARDEITDVLLTGGDPMVMSTSRLSEYILPLLEPRFQHVRTLRIGTKALTYWPWRFIDDVDSADFLRLLERVVASGKHVAIMAHVTHARELRHPACRRAVDLLRGTGALIRSQTPMLRGINDSASALTEKWQAEVEAGIVPYYVFVERDTGANNMFRVPLSRALSSYNEGLRAVSGLARTARGPVMSASMGKVHVRGSLQQGDSKYFVLSYLQARDPEWVGRTFLAQYDEEASWLTGLTPVSDSERALFA